MNKPHKGRIDRWKFIHYSNGDIVVGTFLDHPQFARRSGHTSMVIYYDEDSGELETLNSRYTLTPNEALD